MSVQTLLQRAAGHQYQGRVFGSLGTTTGLLSLGGFGMASVLGDRLGPVTLINVAGVFGCLAAASLMLLQRLDAPERSIEWVPEYVSRSFLRLAEPAVVGNALFAFVTDPQASRRRRRVINELEDGAPNMVDVLELMTLDGVNGQQAVAEYVHAVVGEALAESDP